MVTDSAATAGGWKRWRVDEQGGRREGALVEAIPLDRISVLPEPHPPLAQGGHPHGGAGSRVARPLEEPVAAPLLRRAHLRSRDALRRELDALDREPQPRRRLDRFFLIVDICKLRSSDLRRFLDYAAECCVEDLHVETRKSTVADKLNFHLPPSSPLLARLSLRRISISNMYYKDAQLLHALEVIRLHSVNISQTAVRKMIALCPSLLTLDLRDCDSDDFFYSDKSLAFPPKLRSSPSFIVRGWPVWTWWVSTVCAFLYSGSERSFSILKDAALVELDVCLDDWLSGNWDISLFNKHLPNDLSDLTLLTICPNVLMVASSLVDDGLTAQNPKLSNLQSLRELQLLMLKMGPENLADIYMYIKTC